MNDPKAHPLIQLEGQYARLIPLGLDHAKALVDAANSSRTTFRYTSVPSDLDSARGYIQAALDLYRKGSVLPFAIVERSSGKIVGSTRFLNMEYWEFPEGHALRKSGNVPHVVEIGATWLAESHQRSGINTDAKLCLLTHAFEQWEVLRVCLKTDARNLRSRANIERIGGKLDGVVRAHMKSYDGGIRDTAFYSILREEWPELKVGLRSKLR